MNKDLCKRCKKELGDKLGQYMDFGYWGEEDDEHWVKGYTPCDELLFGDDGFLVSKKLEPHDDCFYRLEQMVLNQ